MKFKLIFFSLFFFATTVAISQIEHVPGEILVQFSAKTNPRNILENYAGTRLSGIVLGKLLSKPMNIYKVEFDPATIDENDLLHIFRADKNVLNAQFNHYISLRETTPDDPQFGSQWHHVNDGSSGTVDADIDSDLAWDITTGGLTAQGDTIVVCVIEGGNLNHVDLIDNAWFNHHEIPDNGIDDDNNGYIDDYRGWNVDSETDGGLASDGHGTNVLGMIGATGNNDLEVSGINWNVKMMVVGGEDANDEASVVAAYTYPLVQRQLYEATGGQEGAFVVVTNASWGIDGGNPDDVPIWAAFYDTLGTHGILNCGATTNNNVNVDVVGDIPTAVPSDYMISVTATNSNDVRTFSGYGQKTVDLGAPGANVVTTAGQSGTTTTSGTSFASPLTAGVIALLYSAPCEELSELAHSDPKFAADFVRYALLTGVDSIENLELETATGGRLNAFNSLSVITQVCDSGFCIPPLAFSYSLADDTVYTFSWSATANTNASIRFRQDGDSLWTYASNFTSNSFQIDSLTHCASYQFEIAGSCTGEPTEADYNSTLIIETEGCCVAPQDVSVSDATETTIELSWTPGLDIDGYTIYQRLSGETDWILSGNSASGSLSITGLESCTSYDFLVVADCMPALETGTLLNTTTPGCGYCIDTQFCATGGETTAYEYIDKVEIGSFVNESGNNGGYTLFENSGLELVRAEDYEVTFTPGFGSFGSYDEYFVVWIDLNTDGEFSENEKIYESEAGSSLPSSGEITIPSQANLGDNRMRISMKAIDPTPNQPDPCGSYSYGETEDYCIAILDSVSGISNPSDLSLFQIYPNPANSDFSLNFKPSHTIISDNFSIRIIDLTGKKVAQRSVSPGLNSIPVNLDQGIYLLQLLRADGKIIYASKLLITS